MERKEQIARLKSEHFDLCIIGAGASGAGCALDAALRGMKVLLIDRSDFASATSAASTKLIHGGVRYLEQAFKKLDFAQLRQVRHGLEERHIVLSNAPHLARPLKLITPVFSWIEGLYFTIGLKMYDWFASDKDNLPASKWLKKEAVTRAIPTISQGIHSAVQYYDGQLDDARYAFLLAKAAQEAGATVVNYMALTEFKKDASGKITGALTQDRLLDNDGLYTVNSKFFLNCTGPFSDAVRLMATPGVERRLRPSKGVHITLPADVLGNEAALLIPKTSDGRVVFAIPFQDKVIVGTTDDAYTDLDHTPSPNQKESAFLASTLQRYLSISIDTSQIKAGFGGVRPLITSSRKKQTKGLLRDHEVEIDAESGLFSLLGGKWTTYRLMARDAVNVLAKAMGNTSGCSTESHLLPGAEGFHINLWEEIRKEYSFDEDICRHLARNYGTRVWEVLVLLPTGQKLNERLTPGYPFIGAEVMYAAQKEMCRTVHDFLAYRIRLEILDWNAALLAAEKTAEILGTVLAWDKSRITAELNGYHQRIKSFQEGLKM